MLNLIFLFIMKNLSLFFCLMIPFIGYAQNDAVWEYPVLPGTESWVNLENHQEKVDVCQIPNDVLNVINTSQLLQLCLDYPLLTDIYAFNSMSNGFDAFYSNFNGIRELVKREDAVEYLLIRYKLELEQQIAILNNSVVPLITKGDYIFKISSIEMILGCNQLQSGLSKITQKAIMRDLLSGYEKKYESLSEFKGFGFHANVYSRANIINKINPYFLLSAKNKGVSQLVHSVNKDAASVEELNQMSYELIKE